MKKIIDLYIYMPSKSAMQSGLYNSDKWCLLSSDINEFFKSSKFGWNGSTNPEKKNSSCILRHLMMPQDLQQKIIIILK